MSTSDGTSQPADLTDAQMILVVEDHAATRQAILALLGRAFPTYQLLAAESAEEALPLCALRPPCVVVMDISLPGMNGIEATHEIKQMLPHIHVVMHSNNDMQVYREESAAAGASAFVTKGHHSQELIRAIAGLLSLPSAG